jgi:uncharacterized lipoprotein YddW (UPF0748 family)
MRRIAVWVIGSLITTATLLAEPRTEYRAFWVDTFNTVLNNHTDVQAVVNNAKASKANALFAQVRRRGDSWYLNTLEPMADRTPLQPGFDPLQDLINTAHAEGIEVHAFVIMNAIWGRAPNLFPPENPNHAFNQHGGFNAALNRIEVGPNNWLTRTLLPDGAAGVAYQGHRFGNDFWVDPGHPAAADYTAEVIHHLVANYDIDGLHLDRIRYPEIGIAGQTPATGTSIGYNPTSIARFNLVHGASGTPAQNNALWNQWRRDQVTNLVRRVYLESIAIKPDLIVSAALIAFGGGPVCPFGQTCATDKEIWEKSASAEAYWRVYQDWRAWTEEGIIDIAMPMAYKAEHTPAVATQFNQWNEWTKNHQYNRGAMMGLGGLSNAVEGTLRQTRRALTPSVLGNTDLGVIYFSMFTSNIAVTNNPFAIPVRSTPARTFAEFASGLTTGGSVDGLTRYEPVGPVPIFAEQANIPALTWKESPTAGHLMGFARRFDETAVDTGKVFMDGLGHSYVRETKTDGNGFFGGVDLPPGEYLVRVEMAGEVFYSCPVTVTAGTVARADAGPDSAPVIDPAPIAASTDPGACSAVLDVTPPRVTDNCSGIEVEGTRDDGLALTDPFPTGETIITWTATDTAGQSAEDTQTVTVTDHEGPTITAVSVDKPELWPANHKMTTVRVAYGATDNCGTVQTTSLSVSSNEPVNGLEDGDTSPDWEIVNNHEVKLRAERSGTGTGRIYTITITATDGSNTSSTNVMVQVPISRGTP